MTTDLASLITPSVDDHLEALMVTCHSLEQQYSPSVLKRTTRKLLETMTALFGSDGEAYLVQGLLLVNENKNYRSALSSGELEQIKDRICYEELLVPVLLTALRHFRDENKTLSETTQKHIVNYNKTWTALFPMQFESRIIESIYPGLLSQAYIVNAMTDLPEDRVYYMQKWLAGPTHAPSISLPAVITDSE